MTYFTNMVSSFYNSDFQNDVIYAARDMLVKALENQKESMKYFNMSSDDDADIFWAMSCEANERAKGLLLAYQILTNRKVINISSVIEDEIRSFDDLFELA